MKPWKTLATAGELVLQERDGVFVIRTGGHELMSSARHGSEEAMAEVALGASVRADTEVLIGGLGLGYTLRAALERIGPRGRVTVLELSDAVIDWNRGPLAHLAGRPLEDPRVTLEKGDVGRYVRRQTQRFDAVLLDVDNGPAALSSPANQQLYSPAGLAAFRAVLRPGGTLVVWSAGPAPRFVEALRKAGFDAREQSVHAAGTRGTRHVLFVGKVRPPRATSRGR